MKYFHENLLLDQASAEEILARPIADKENMNMRILEMFGKMELPDNYWFEIKEAEKYISSLKIENG